MPLLAGLLSKLFTGAGGLIAGLMAARQSANILAATTIAGLFGILWMAGQVCAQSVCGPVVNGISNSHPNFAVGLGLVFNAANYTIFSCYVTFWAAVQLFVFKKKMIQLATGN